MRRETGEIAKEKRGKARGGGTEECGERNTARIKRIANGPKIALSCLFGTKAMFRAEGAEGEEQEEVVVVVLLVE